jgi:type II secretory ATPase GspE/PulE/Tfp pilus assembly ATPase PilB-like protein
MPLEGIDLAPDILAAFRAEISKPYGLILACGPTGSGKTTTLHSVLHSLNSPQRKIWTAEDPVEIVQRNISQVQVRPKIGWTFAMALRSFLRADPDVIMIGEIRDDETAKVAVEASMTGHLVLSTLHTNSAPETLARLLDLNIEPFNLADAALAILAQRLARRICRDCGETVTLGGDEIDTLLGEHFCALPGSAPSHSERDRQLAEWSRIYANGGPLTARRRVGCPACNGTGYRGRIGIHELLVVTPEIRHLIRSRASTGSIVTAAIAGGMRPLRQDGIAKVLQGYTDLAEVRMVCL